MKVKYGFKEQLMDFLKRGPKAVLAAALVTIFVAFIVVGGLLIPEMGVAVLMVLFCICVGWALVYVIDNWR